MGKSTEYSICDFCGHRHPRGGAHSWDKEPKVIQGTKHIAALPPDTKMIVVGDKAIVAGPNQPAAVVTDDGLVPIKPKKGGRPRSDGPSKGASPRAEYQRELMRKRLAEGKVKRKAKGK